MALTRQDFETSGDALPRPHDNCYWLLPGRLLAGEYPGSCDPQQHDRRLRALLDSGIRRVIDLTAEGERLPHYADALQSIAATRTVDVRRHAFPIGDFGVPDRATMRGILDAIATALAARDAVYLHCHGGIGRTGTVVGCLLVEHGFTAAQALALIADKWRVMAKRGLAPESPETAEQRAFIAGWDAGPM
jgi:hypothetical protein